MHKFSVLLLATAIPASGDISAVTQAASRESIMLEVQGSSPQPSASLEAAVALAQAARRQRPDQKIVISLPPGVIHLAKPVVFTSANGGTVSSPLIIRGQADGSTIISGAETIASASSVESLVDLTRIAPELKLDLTANSVETSPPDRRLVLFQGPRFLNLTSWPAKGYASGWTAGTKPTELRPAKGTVLPKGTGLIAAGYPVENWRYEAAPARSDGTSLILSRDPSAGAFQKAVRLKIFNVPGPLAPGRYVVDRNRLRVRGFDSTAPIEIATANSLFTFDGAHDVRIENVALEKTRGTAVTVVNSENISFSNCFIGLTGGYAIDVADGRNVHVEQCVVAQTGAGGIRLNGGNRTTLQAGHNEVRDSLIVNFAQSVRTYAPGVALTGVGNVVSGSFIGGSPHTGIILFGNDHLVDGNELGFLDCETNDASAIYMGRDWTQRGNRLTRNFIHDIGSDDPDIIVSGIYLDDQFSSAEIDHNLFLRMPHGIFIGGGRDNHLHDNVFGAMTRSAVWIDDRGRNWQKDAAGPGGLLRQLLTSSAYMSPIWRARYPNLTHLLQNQPGSPVGNVAENNISVGAPFLWASPMTLKIPGEGNQEVPVTTEQRQAFASGIEDRQYRALRENRLIASRPGLHKALLFASYAKQSTACPSN